MFVCWHKSPARTVLYSLIRMNHKFLWPHNNLQRLQKNYSNATVSSIVPNHKSLIKSKIKYLIPAVCTVCLQFTICRVEFVCDRNSLKAPLCLHACFCTQLVHVQPTCHSFAMQSTWPEQVWLWKTWPGWHFHRNPWSVCVRGSELCDAASNLAAQGLTSIVQS